MLFRSPVCRLARLISPLDITILIRLDQPVQIGSSLTIGVSPVAGPRIVSGMADLAMAAVVCLCVDTVELLHQAGKIATAGVDDKVVMVIHEAVGQRDRIESGKRL